MVTDLEQRVALACAVTLDVPSPCVSICRMDAQNRWCQGCWRSLAEIIDWAQMDNSQKRAVWHQLPQRQRLECSR